MPSMVDHVADVGRTELVRLSKVYEFPDFVKRADMDRTFATGMPATAYADPRTKQFPCHTKASTWLSALYFQEKKAEFHPKDQARIVERIDEYAGYWNIKVAVDRMRARWAEHHKTAEDRLPDSSYAFVWTGENGVKERKLRVSNAMEVKVAAEWLFEHCDRIPFSDRNVIATRIVEKANHFGVGLGKVAEFIERQAGRGVCDPAEVVGLIRERASLAKAAGLKGHFLKMAQTVADTPRQALLPDMLVKLATTLDQLDRNLGLIPRYAEGLRRPENVIFSATFNKVASDLAASVGTTSGKMYSKTDLKKLAAEDVRALFGDEFADRVMTPLGDVDCEKMAEEMSALPRPDAEMLDGLLSDTGVSPVATKSASVRQGLTETEKKAWAAAYSTVT